MGLFDPVNGQCSLTTDTVNLQEIVLFLINNNISLLTLEQIRSYSAHLLLQALGQQADFKPFLLAST